jgi:hypothetical protein
MEFQRFEKIFKSVLNPSPVKQDREDAGSGQHARDWALPAGTLDPSSCENFSEVCNVQNQQKRNRKILKGKS